MTMPQISTGKVLLAEPFMMGSNFKRAAILLTEHTDKEGSVGFIMNKQLEMNITELVADFPEFESPTFFGGPVATDTIHYIHNVGDLLEKSTKIGEGIYWGGDFEKLKFLIDSKMINPQNIRFFVGYSGWSEGQLQDELKSGSWIVADMDANYLFNTKHTELWKQIMNDKGDRYEAIADMPDSSNFN